MTPEGCSRTRTARGWVLAGVAVALVMAVVAAVAWTATRSAGGRAANAARGSHAPSSAPGRLGGALLGPGCGLPGVDLANVGTAQLDGRPVLAGRVGEPTTIPVAVDRNRPGLDTTATVVVAAPGTNPGRGFASTAQSAAGAPTLDDRSRWKASAQVAVRAQKSSLVVTFTPTVAGPYPVYAILHATSTAAAPPLCGGVPDKGGDGQNLVGWIQVS